MDWTSMALTKSSFTSKSQLSFNRMSVNQLQWYIVCLLKNLFGTGNIPWGISSCKPSWWPDDVPWDVREDTRDEVCKQKVPWKEALCKVIHKCLKHYGKEDISSKCAVSLSPSCPQTFKSHSNTGDSSVKNAGISYKGADFVDSKATRSLENSGSPFKKILGTKVDLGINFVDNYHITENLANKQKLEVFTCNSCEAEYFTVRLLQEHLAVCINRLVAFDESSKKLDQCAFLSGLALASSENNGKLSNEKNLKAFRKIVHMCQLSKSSLSRIDFSSPLGRKFVTETRLEFHENLCPYERFCATTQQRLYRSVTVWSKYPVTFKPKCRDSQCHRYKFNRAQKEEFKLILKTGLNRRGRMLLSRCKKMSVVLQRLSKKEINYWLSKRDLGTQSLSQETYITLPTNRISSSTRQNSSIASEEDLCIIKVIQHGEDIIVDILGDHNKQNIGNTVFNNSNKNRLHFSRPQPPPLLGEVTWQTPTQKLTSPLYDHSYINSLFVDKGISSKTGLGRSISSKNGPVIDCKVVLEDIMHKVVVEGGIAKVKDTRFELYNKEGLSAGERCSFEPRRPSKIAFSSYNDRHHKRGISEDVFHAKLSPGTNHSVDDCNDRYLKGNPMLIGKENCAHRLKSYDSIYSDSSALKLNCRFNSIHRINCSDQRRPSFTITSESSKLSDRLKMPFKNDSYKMNSVTLQLSNISSPKRSTTFYNTRGPAKRSRPLHESASSSAVRFKCHVCNLDEFLGFCPQSLIDYHMSSHGPLEFFYVEYVQQIGSATIPVVEACLKEVLPSLVENHSNDKGSITDESRFRHDSEIASNYYPETLTGENFKCMISEFPNGPDTNSSAYINGDREDQSEIVVLEELIIVD